MALPIPHPTGTSLPHITNSFLSHFLAGGGVQLGPSGLGQHRAPEARPRPHQLASCSPPPARAPAAAPAQAPAGPAPGPTPPPRPLARSGSEPSGSGL